jgi:hypothetical protein
MKPDANSFSRALCLFASLALLALATCSSPPPPPEPLPGFTDVVKSSSLTIYPPLLRRNGVHTYDDESAQTLAAFFQQRSNAKVVVSNEEIQGYNPKYGEPRQRFYLVSDSIREHLRTHPLQTDLGAWAVYVFSPGTNLVGEIHVELFDKNGGIVRRFSIDEVEQTVHTPADCTRLVISTIEDRERIYAPKPTPAP